MPSLCWPCDSRSLLLAAPPNLPSARNRLRHASVKRPLQHPTSTGLAGSRARVGLSSRPMRRKFLTFGNESLASPRMAGNTSRRSLCTLLSERAKFCPASRPLAKRCSDPKLGLTPARGSPPSQARKAPP